MSFYSEQLQQYIRNLYVNEDNVLDIGGSQDPIKGRTRTFNVKNYKILDLPEPHECKMDADYFWDLNNELVKGTWLYKTTRDKFDVVFCLEVMEYIFDPVAALKNIGHFMKNGGTLYISFPFVYPLHKPIEQDYLRYTSSGVIKTLEIAEFGIEEIHPRLAKDGNKLLDFYKSDGMHVAGDANITGFIIKAIKV